jgi:hypothetical protein
MPLRICEQVKQLSNDELRALLAEVREEQDIRQRKEYEADWNEVRDAIATFTHKWGSIEVFLRNHPITEGISIYEGHYRMDSFGEIEVDA